MFGIFTKFNLYLVGAAIIGCFVCFWAGRMTAPVKTVTVVQTITVDKTTEEQKIADIVKRTIEETAKIQLDKDITETKTTKTMPDGSKVEEVVTTDKSKTAIDNSKKISEDISHTEDKSKTIEHSTSVTETKTVETAKKNWHVSLMGGKDVQFGKSVNEMFSKDWIYGAQLERRLFGDLYVGAYGQSNSEMGLSLGFSF